MYSGLSNEQLSDIRELFNVFDQDGDGKISPAEIESVVSALGGEISTEELYKIMDAADIDRSGQIDFEEFVVLVEKAMFAEFVEELAAVFQEIDADGDGFLNRDELRQALAGSGERFSEANIDQIIQEADLDADGRIDFEEFVVQVLTLIITVAILSALAEQLIASFVELDQDGDGYITASELEQTVSAYGDRVSKVEVAQMIQQADVDGDGRVNFQEFVDVALA